MKIIRKISIFVGACLLLAGICYFLYPTYREWRTQREVDTIIAEFEQNREEAIAESQGSFIMSSYDSKDDSDGETDEESGHVSSDEPVLEDMTKTIMPDLYEALVEYNEGLIASHQQVLDAWSYEQSPVDIDSLNKGSSVIGYIEIPDMKNLRLPLYLGASPEHLGKGAAVLTQTSMPIGGTNTNCVISGHRGYRGSAYFQYIDRLQVGSKVYVTNPWETLTYQVVSTKIVRPSQVDEIMIQDGKDMVTLISCHPYVVGGGPERYLVFCERVVETSVDDTTDTDETSTTESQGSTELVNPTVTEEPTTEDEVFSGNDVQRLETLLRILGPITVVLIICIILVAKLRYKRS